MADQHYAQNLMELNKAQQDIVRLETQVEHMSRAIDNLTSMLNEQAKTLAAIQKTLSEARGGWKTLMIVGGAASTLGAVLSWIASHVRFAP
jgi:prefoldin subunit 5